MKKKIVVLLALLMVFSIAGCKGGSDAKGSDESWNKVAENKKLILGLDNAFPPMGYVDTKTGELVGFDIDVAKEVCKRLDIELVLQPIDWDSKSVELQNGNIDCIWNGFSKTPERDAEFTLSGPYMKNHQIILVKADSKYTGLDSLKGKIVGVQADSSAETALNSTEDFKASLKEVVTIDDYSKAVLEIQNGTIDAIAIDEVVARYYLANNPGAYRILEDKDGNAASLATESYVIGFRKGDDALKDKVYETLQAMKKDGALTKISEKWFDEDITAVED